MSSQSEKGRMSPILSRRVMPMTEAKRMTPLVRNHEVRRTASLSPIIFMNSRSRVWGGGEGGEGRGRWGREGEVGRRGGGGEGRGDEERERREEERERGSGERRRGGRGREERERVWG